MTNKLNKLEREIREEKQNIRDHNHKYFRKYLKNEISYESYRSKIKSFYNKGEK